MKRMLLSTLLLTSCFEGLPAFVADAPETELQPSQSRTVELRMLRLDVKNFEQRLTLEDLRGLPHSTLDTVWLDDVSLEVLNKTTLERLRDADPESLESQGARNMQKLLRLTANDVDFSRTSLEDLLSLGGTIGVAPAKAVADLLQVGRNDPLLPIEFASDALLKGLVGTHPNTQWRQGIVDAEHPDGRWPVAPASIPITLGDVVENFERLSRRFGEAELPDGRVHPGFIVEAKGFAVIEDAFAMIVKVNANALPFKGVDLSLGSRATVNGIGSQIETLFNTEDPNWMRVDGMVERPYIERVRLRVSELPEFVGGGDAREPRPTGNSPVWDLDPWWAERLVAEMARTWAQRLAPLCVEYTVGADTVAYRACVDDEKWVTFETFNGVGNPPPGQYLWDIELEMAQVRLHDGGLMEGEATVEFTIEDAEMGFTSAELLENIKANLAANPRALRDLANLTNETTQGEADFYYYRTRPGAPEAVQGDYLYFISEKDIPAAEGGTRLRPYSYAKPGFYADAALTQKVSTKAEVEGDAEHEKVRVEPGHEVFLGDDGGRVFSVRVLRKPSLYRLVVEVSRIQ